MPPHLHPRSRMTSSLFATTVAVSFFVVALPHILPCPAPRVTYADSSAGGAGSATTVVIVEHNEDGTITTTTRQRRRRKPAAQAAEGKDAVASFGDVTGSSSSNNNINTENLSRLDAMRRSNLAGMENSNEMPTTMARTRTRECPVPKPGGVLGELLSYINNKDKKSSPGGGNETQQQPDNDRIITTQAVEVQDHTRPDRKESIIPRSPPGSQPES